MYCNVTDCMNPTALLRSIRMQGVPASAALHRLLLAASTKQPTPFDHHLTAAARAAGAVQDAQSRRVQRDIWLCVNWQGGQCVPCLQPSGC